MIGGKADFAFRAGYFIFTCFLLAKKCVFDTKNAVFASRFFMVYNRVFDTKNAVG